MQRNVSILPDSDEVYNNVKNSKELKFVLIPSVDDEQIDQNNAMPQVKENLKINYLILEEVPQVRNGNCDSQRKGVIGNRKYTTAENNEIIESDRIYCQSRNQTNKYVKKKHNRMKI